MGEGGFHARIFTRRQLRKRAPCNCGDHPGGGDVAFKEVVHVSWTDEDGAHFALFYLGRRQGRAMLAEIKKQTGLEPRDLEKERKAEEKRLKALQGQKAKQAVIPRIEPDVTPE